MNDPFDKGFMNNEEERNEQKDPSNGIKKDDGVRYGEMNTYQTSGTYHSGYEYSYSKNNNNIPAASGDTYTSQGMNAAGASGNGDSPVNQTAQKPQAQYSSAYTWNNGMPVQQPSQGYYGNRPPAPQRIKKKGKRTGVKVLAAFLCCLVVSVSSVGTFAFLINQGYIDVKSESTSTGKAAFTINQVVKEESSDVQQTSTVTEKTPQEVAEALIPSIVCIQNYQASSNDFFSGFSGYGTDSTQSDYAMMLPASEGSGIIYTKDGYIITNAHVVSGAIKLQVVTSDGMSYEAEVVGTDAVTDLAVIRITNPGEKEFTPAEFGSSSDLKVADTVMAIGNPGGMELNSTVTIGYVSALNREVTDSDTGYSIECIQTDAAINPGNSGGALVDMYGHVVGINSSKIVATGYEGLGFAIPTDTAQPIITNLMEYGYVKDRASLGVSIRFVDSFSARVYGMAEGAYVMEVTSVNARNAGLQEYDIITAIDGTPVTSADTIRRYILTKKPGETVSLTINRQQSGEILTIDVELSETKGSD